MEVSGDILAIEISIYNLTSMSKLRSFCTSAIFQLAGWSGMNFAMHALQVYADGLYLNVTAQSVLDTTLCHPLTTKLVPEPQ